MPGRSLTVPSLPRQCHAVAPASHIGQWNIHGRFQAQEAAMTSRMLARLPRADNRRQLFVYGPHALYGFIMCLTRRSLPTAYAPAGRTLAPTDAFAPAATPDQHTIAQASARCPSLCPLRSADTSAIIRVPPAFLSSTPLLIASANNLCSLSARRYGRLFESFFSFRTAPATLEATRQIRVNRHTATRTLLQRLPMEKSATQILLASSNFLSCSLLSQHAHPL